MDCLDALGTWGTSSLQVLPDKLSRLRVDVLDWHVLLVEHNVASNIGSCNTHNVSDIPQDHKAERNVFPEEASILVQDHILVAGRDGLQVLPWDWNHRERHSRVADVGVEDPLER